MAIDDDGSEEAVGAEKNPRKVRRFVWALLSGAVCSSSSSQFFYIYTSTRH